MQIKAKIRKLFANNNLLKEKKFYKTKALERFTHKILATHYNLWHSNGALKIIGAIFFILDEKKDFKENREFLFY
jgi:hypothetical protein